MLRLKVFRLRSGFCCCKLIIVFPEFQWMVGCTWMRGTHHQHHQHVWLCISIHCCELWSSGSQPRNIQFRSLILQLTTDDIVTHKQLSNPNDISFNLGFRSRGLLFLGWAARWAAGRSHSVDIRVIVLCF